MNRLIKTRSLYSTISHSGQNPQEWKRAGGKEKKYIDRQTVTDAEKKIETERERPIDRQNEEERSVLSRELDVKN